MEKSQLLTTRLKIPGFPIPLVNLIPFHRQSLCQEEITISSKLSEIGDFGGAQFGSDFFRVRKNKFYQELSFQKNPDHPSRGT